MRALPIVLHVAFSRARFVACSIVASSLIFLGYLTFLTVVCLHVLSLLLQIFHRIPSHEIHSTQTYRGVCLVARGVIDMVIELLSLELPRLLSFKYFSPH
jgi:hypothetical protein